MTTTKKVIGEIERIYTKNATMEIEVDVNLSDEALRDYLINDYEIDNKLENALVETDLIENEVTYQYYDSLEQTGGHL